MKRYIPLTVIGLAVTTQREDKGDNLIYVRNASVADGR